MPAPSLPRRSSLLRRVDRSLFDGAAPHADRFGWLLVVVIGSLGVLSLIDLGPSEPDASSDVGAIVVSILLGAMLMLAARASGLARRWRRIADVIAVLAVIGSGLVLASTLMGDAEPRVGRPSAIWVAVSVLMPIAVVRRVLSHRRVGLSTLLGSVCAYLLIAFTFTFAFLAVEAAQSEDFFGQPEPTTSFMYFSLTSITTLGYGDLSAATPLGRLLATSEAVIGQIFLVTLVAALVGLYARRAR